MTERTEQPSVSLGAYADKVSEAVAKLEADDVVSRIWAGDHTVWRDDPDEIENRLGWLTVIGDMREHVADLRAFADEVKGAFFKHAVLLGMGGSSLGPEVIRQTLGSADGYPELIVLDSTLPTSIRAVTSSIDPAHTLFVVSSKSGGTIEPNSLYKHFRPLVESAVGQSEAGSHFVAITDPGTPLATLAEAESFRRTFENPPAIGGRYSVLSFFGLVPAALMGVDLGRLLDRASTIAASCGASMDTQRNPAAWLGALMAATSQGGRDKLTLVASPSIASFGLWAEQLLAESTGKDGKGIVPISGEPLLETDAYGDDRLFVYLRVEGDDNAVADVATERLAAAGHPVVRFDLRDGYDLGAEFFRWEFATAVAGALLGIHPFDQPNVQAAKDATDSVLGDFIRDGALPETGEEGSLPTLLEQASPGDYVAVMGYVPQTAGVDSAIVELRRRVMEHHHVATTFGYGPRFLHSTGQLHKGGPNTGLFVQLTTDETNLDIPGQPYGFGTLAAAQSIGDYRALESAGRRVVRLGLGNDAESGLLRLLATI
jgi:glucose-6-phosphate isomerase/transaldolase/glucose-6-phosphate isomerase